MKTAVSPQDTLIFLHILKTGGTTLNMILENYFPTERSFATFPNRRHPHGSFEAFRALSAAEKGQIDFLTGHMGFGLHEELPRTAVYITLLRNPIERVISRYYHEKKDPHSHLHQQIQDGMSLKEYMQFYTDVAEMDNLQTRMIAGNWEERGYGPCTTEMLAMAQQNIENHFILVGVTERFDEFFLLLKNLFGWPSSSYIQYNVTKNRPKQDAFSQDTIELIRQHNQYDFQLYDYVEAQFDHLLTQQNNQFQTELKKIQFKNFWATTYFRFRQVSVRHFLKTKLRLN